MGGGGGAPPCTTVSNGPDVLFIVLFIVNTGKTTFASMYVFFFNLLLSGVIYVLLWFLHTLCSFVLSFDYETFTSRKVSLFVCVCICAHARARVRACAHTCVCVWLCERACGCVIENFEMLSEKHSPN